jgi:hypothetical protein
MKEKTKTFLHSSDSVCLARTRPWFQPQRHSHTLTLTPTLTHPHPHLHSHSHSQTHTHTHTHTHTPTHTNTHTHTWNTDTALQIMKQVHLLTWNYKINKQSMIRRRMHEQEHSRERRVKEEYNTNDQTKVKEWETCACREGGSCPGILILSTSFLHSLLVNASC